MNTSQVPVIWAVWLSGHFSGTCEVFMPGFLFKILQQDMIAECGVDTKQQ
jgi:hypothetical protein